MYIQTQSERLIYIYEIKKLIKKITEIFYNSIDLFHVLAKYNLEKVDLMVIDSALKGMNLERLDRTLLIIPERYNQLLKKLIYIFIELLQNETDYPVRIVK